MIPYTVATATDRATSTGIGDSFNHQCDATYIDVMAINYRKLQVDKTVLAKALCTLLAQVARKHASHNKKETASVAHPLDCNQRRSIISPRMAERALSARLIARKT